MTVHYGSSHTSNPHTTDTTDAHAASAITNTPAGSVAATTVQAAIDELATDYAAADSTHAAAADPHTGYALELSPPWLQATVNLTDAQLKATNSAPPTLVAAGGANTIIQVLSAAMALDNAAGVYVGGGTLTLAYGTSQTANLASSTFMTADASASKVAYTAPAFLTGSSGATNVAVTLRNATADFTGGNAANKATVTVVYRVLTTLPA